MTEHRATVVVAGAGPAGMAAAVTAAEHGCATLLVDEAAAPGGQVWRAGTDASRQDVRAARWRARLAASGVRVLARTTVIDAPSPLELLGECDGEPVRITATGAIIMATGARELFLPFPGWTLPGVVGAGGAQALLKSGWNVRGRTVVVAGSGPLLLPVAAALARAGARVRAVVEQAPRASVLRFALGLWRTPSRATDAVRYRAAFATTPYLTGWWVTSAQGDDAVRRVVLSNGRSSRTIECDVLCSGYGLVPSAELARLIGCAMHGDAVQVDEMQRTSVAGVYCAGEPTGIAGLDAAITQGIISGLAATGRESSAARLLPVQRAQLEFAERARRAFALRDELRQCCERDTIVCRCEDVQCGAVASCTSLREAKLLTRAGMGACQGRVCGPALRHLHGWEVDSVRPPLTPVRASALAT